MIEFQPITEDSLEYVLEIINSNPNYNILENGNPLRSIDEVRSEFLNQTTDSYLVLMGNSYIGIIDFLKNNPNDNCPWIGLLMIHGEYHSLGYGKKAYMAFEERLKQQNYGIVRIGVLKENTSANKYWTSLGFRFYKNSEWEGKLIECLEKPLIY